MTYLLDKTRIRGLKAEYDKSHCDCCKRSVSMFTGRCSSPAKGKVRCERCTVTCADEEAPTAKLVRPPVAPPPCGVAS